MKNILFTVAFLILFASLHSQEFAGDSAWIVNNYYKIEKMIPMRDGVKLFTSIYIPKDSSQKHPMLMRRTPYSCAPYGTDKFKKDWWNFWYREYFKLGYIMIMQDVRGRYMSEGVYEDIRPFIKDKKTNRDIDEASDTYDAIDWLVKNVPSNNGNVGVYGVSYPGFYSTMAALSGHPALKAVSPQAPVTDWFIGDDVHHNGAFFLMDWFDFSYSFGKPRPQPTTVDAPDFVYPTPDNYNFFLNAGSIKSISEKYLGDTMKFWKDIRNHPNRDEYWKAHTVTPHLQNIKPAMLITGGLFDAEDVWGTWNTYKNIEKQSTGTINHIVMGPWFHGGWYRSDGSKLGNVQFGSKTGGYYYRNIEIPFFNYYLLGKGAKDELAEATIFFTGENKWKTLAEWPPKNVASTPLYLHEKNTLSFTKPISAHSFDEYISDPAHPVPYTEDVHIARTREYMTDDQRFASRRPDVLTFKTDALQEDVTISGPVIADLLVSLSTTDADLVVKIIDVFPDDFKYPDSLNIKYPMGGYEMLVRGDIMRGRYRNSYENPEAFVPGRISEVKFELPDVAHTFLKNHKIMVQIQSTWFPLVDRNPQQFVDIYRCDEKDFVKSNIKIYHDSVNSSGIWLPIMKK